jgi:PIN domain nuclease of toxin-antitoxin system
VSDPVLLDTCAALWWIGGLRISDPAQKAIRGAQSTKAGVYVSPFTAWEIGTLAAKGRMKFAVPPDQWFENLLELPGVRLAELTPKILIASTALPGRPPADPADRIIVATARQQELVLVTRDQKLLSYARSGHLRFVRC